MLDRVKAGEEFADLAKKAVAEGTAKGGDQGQYLKAKEIIPAIAAVVSKMTTGSVSPIIPIKAAENAKAAGYALVKLEGIRQVDSPGEKERTRQEALKNAKVEALQRYSQTLITRYAVVHRAVLDGLDFEAKGFEKFLKDGRVLAEIKGEKPLTVGDLAEQLRHQLFHGAAQAAEAKKLNEKIVPAFHEMLYRRVFRKEALRLGLDKTAAYTARLRNTRTLSSSGVLCRKLWRPTLNLLKKTCRNITRNI